MSQAIVTSKGQITIPKDVRESLSLKSGNKVDFIVSEMGDALIRPVSMKAKNVFGYLSDSNRKPFTIKEINDKLKNAFRDMNK